jgi:hypothetical protein
MAWTPAKAERRFIENQKKTCPTARTADKTTCPKPRTKEIEQKKKNWTEKDRMAQRLCRDKLQLAQVDRCEMSNS